MRRVITDIRPQLQQKGGENWVPRLEFILASSGLLKNHMSKKSFYYMNSSDGYIKTLKPIQSCSSLKNNV